MSLGEAVAALRAVGQRRGAFAMVVTGPRRDGSEDKVVLAHWRVAARPRMSTGDLELVEK